MYKRKAEDELGSSIEKKVAPVPRNLSLQTVTIHFCQRSWEEIGPGELYYLPLCQNPKYMFDKAMMEQFRKFLSFGATMEIHTPTVKISNLIMLQDDLKVQSNTPTDATAFTQVCYLMHYSPTRNPQYFKLQNVTDEETFDALDISYNLSTNKGNNRSYLVKAKNYTNFEKLLICPAKTNIYAGFNVHDPPVIEPVTFKLKSPYISPSLSDPDFAKFSGNVEFNEPSGFLTNGNHITYAKNLDKLTMYKYGDTFELPITTNLEGVQLLNINENNFLVDFEIKKNFEPDIIATYKSEWCYPGPNRPFLTRSNNFDAATDPITNIKNLKNLRHHFLTMPPIKKPNGALLGQRCSFMMEQCMSITFNAVESVWEEGTDNLILDQKDAVILRRNIYGNPTIKRGPPDGSTGPYVSYSPFKKNNKPMYAAGDKDLSLFFT